jgi:hypothetical protein
LLTPPRSMADTYRKFFPDASDDEVARVYTARIRAAQSAAVRKLG